jgi:hypothetical protein
LGHIEAYSRPAKVQLLGDGQEASESRQLWQLAQHIHLGLGRANAVNKLIWQITTAKKRFLSTLVDR